MLPIMPAPLGCVTSSTTLPSGGRSSGDLLLSGSTLTSGVALVSPTVRPLMGTSFSAM